MVGLDGVRDALQHHGLTGLGRRHDECALTFSDGRHQVDDARCEILGGTVAALEGERLVGKQWGQVLEGDLVLGIVRTVEVDLIDLEKREVTFAFLRWPDLSGNRIAGTQAESSDLAWGNVNVVRACQVGTVRRSQESESVLSDFQHTIAVNVLTLLGMRLEDAEDDVLFSRARDALNPHFLRQRQQFRGGQLLEFS